jgi:hypothetical protein
MHSVLLCVSLTPTHEAPNFLRAQFLSPEMAAAWASSCEFAWTRIDNSVSEHTGWALALTDNKKVANNRKKEKFLMG